METAKRYSINDIQSEMTADGSHWWDHATMRCFGTRQCGPVFHGDEGIFFATSDKQYDGSRAYTLRQYNPETKEISTVGSLGDYDSRGKAITAAKNAAGANATRDRGELRPITEGEQFANDCKRHGKPDARVTDCDQLRSAAKRHARYMVDCCNGRELFDAEGEELPPLKQNRQNIRTLAHAIGAKVVQFSGDPRGCTVKLIWNDGETNDFGKEGWCVPGA